MEDSRGRAVSRQERVSGGGHTRDRLRASRIPFAHELIDEDIVFLMVPMIENGLIIKAKVTRRGCPHTNLLG